MVAIIPAAGKGTRMEVVTHGKPKELLRLGHSTVLGLIYEEALLCDPNAVVVVSSLNKPDLSSAATALGAQLELQLEPAGLADAILSAGVDDDAIVLYGDCVFAGSSPAPRLAELIRKGIDGAIAVEQVSDEETHLYGIVEVDEYTGAVRRIIEKPGPDATLSRWAVAARFACGIRLMAFITGYAMTQPYQEGGKEVQMTTILQAAIDEGFDIKAVTLQPGQHRIDCGSPEGYLEGVHLNWD